MNKKSHPAVFLVGCPRSGTTLLQSMLSAHSTITSFPESHFFTKGFGGSHLQRLQKSIRRGYHLYDNIHPWLEKVESNFDLTPNEIQRRWTRRSMVQQFAKQLDIWTAKQYKSIWIEKTPMHLDHIHQITCYLPDSRFIHIIRDGRAVVASLYDVTRKNPEVWGGPRSLSACIAQWNRCAAMSLAQLHNSHHHFVLYESLVKAPETVLNSLCRFLNVPFEPAMLHSFGDASKKVTLDQESWKARNSSELKSTGLALYRQLFDAEQQQKIEAGLNLKATKEIQDHETSI